MSWNMIKRQIIKWNFVRMVETCLFKTIFTQDYAIVGVPSNVIFNRYSRDEVFSSHYFFTTHSTQATKTKSSCLSQGGSINSPRMKSHKHCLHKLYWRKDGGGHYHYYDGDNDLNIFISKITNLKLFNFVSIIPPVYRVTYCRPNGKCFHIVDRPTLKEAKLIADKVYVDILNGEIIKVNSNGTVSGQYETR